RASPTKFATVIGALSSNSSQLSAPKSVSMVASNFPSLASPAVASASVNTPATGSPSAEAAGFGEGSLTSFVAVDVGRDSGSGGVDSQANIAHMLKLRAAI